MFTYMVSRAIEKGKKCLIITDRTELLLQAGGSLSHFGLKPIEIKSGKKIKTLNGFLYTAMAQTLKRRINKEIYLEWVKNLDLIIIDEAHKQEFNKILPFINDKTIVIGATATPIREGNQVSLDGFYNDIVNVVSISELINLGFLAKPNSFGVKVDLSKVDTKGFDFDDDQVAKKFDEVKLYKGVYENYTKLTPNKKGIIFSSNIKSSKQLVDEFKQRGLDIEHLDGKTSDFDRKRILDWFKKTPNALLSNVGILNTGFDEPTIEVVILYRATKSLSLFLQMCGRGGRKTENKTEFTILDFGNNIQRHGFWEQDRDWSLKKKKKKDGLAPVKDCPSCNAILPARDMICKYCNHIFEKTEKEKEGDVIVELQKMTYQQIQDEIKTADFKKLEDIAKAKGYKNTWIYYHLKTEKDIIDYAKYKGYHSKWVEHQINLREQKNENRE